MSRRGLPEPLPGTLRDPELRARGFGSALWAATVGLVVLAMVIGVLLEPAWRLSNHDAMIDQVTDGQLRFSVWGLECGESEPGVRTCETQLSVSNVGDQTRTYDPGAQLLVMRGGIEVPGLGAAQAIPPGTSGGDTLRWTGLPDQVPDRILFRDSGEGGGAWIGIPEWAVA